MLLSILQVVFEELFFHILTEEYPLLFNCFTMVIWEMAGNLFVILFNLLGFLLILLRHEVVVSADKLNLGL